MAVITKHSEKMNFCAVELVSKGECDPNECRFNHDIKLSIIWKDRNANNGESSQSSKPICFKEFSEKQSCPYGDECHFDHKFPDALRQDPKVASRIKEEREKKASKCVNEYHEKGSCKIGEKLCRFSHNITQDELDDPSMQLKMRTKLEMMKKKTAVVHQQQNNKESQRCKSNTLIEMAKQMAELQKTVEQIQMQKTCP